MTKIAYFPGNTAALDVFRRSPAFQVIPDRKIGGYHVIHTPIRAVVSGNTAC